MFVVSCPVSLRHSSGKIGVIPVKKVLYVLNDCMRKFSYTRIATVYSSLQETGEPCSLFILRTDAYAGFAPEHNLGEYNLYRLPDYAAYDAIILDVNSVFNIESGHHSSGEVRELLQAAAASGRPVISIANHIPGVYYVGIDNYDAMVSVIRHLHENRGLKDFWFAMGPAGNYENEERTRGLLDYCAAHDLPCGDDRIFSESFIIESGLHAFTELLERHHGRLPQAVICANDHIAMGVCHAAAAAGFRVPDDFLVTGFDNTALSASFSPPITSLDQQSWNIGKSVVSVLRGLWRGESFPEMIKTPTRLVLRESTEGISASGGDIFREAADYLGRSSSATDFNYKMSALQYKLPGCRTIEEICLALTECISALNCEGIDLVLDSRLFDLDRVLSFRNETGQLQDISSDLNVKGYPDTLELAFHWEKGSEPVFPHQRIGACLSALPFGGGSANYLTSPLHFMEHTVGFLCIRNCLDLVRIKGVSVTVSTLTMALRAFFSSRSLAYFNRMLSGVSMKDGLTGLYNRLGYHELAYPLYRKASAAGSTMAILFLDMDRLQHMNDVYGHGAGDQAILCVAGAIRQNVPPEAVPVRYGGDEFLVLLPDSGEEEARKLLEAVTASIASGARELCLPETPEISSGFVIARPDGSKSLDEYVEEADSLMYREKKAKKGHR